MAQSCEVCGRKPVTGNQVTTRGKDVLADLLEQLARLQALNRKLRSPRIDEDTERMLATRRNFDFLTLRERPLPLQETRALAPEGVVTINGFGATTSRLPDSSVSQPGSSMSLRDLSAATENPVPATPDIAIEPEIDLSRLIRIDLFC